MPLYINQLAVVMLTHVVPITEHTYNLVLELLPSVLTYKSPTLTQAAPDGAPVPQDIWKELAEFTATNGAVRAILPVPAIRVVEAAPELEPIVTMLAAAEVAMLTV